MPSSPSVAEAKAQAIKEVYRVATERRQRGHVPAKLLKLCFDRLENALRGGASYETALFHDRDDVLIALHRRIPTDKSSDAYVKIYDELSQAITRVGDRLDKVSDFGLPHVIDAKNYRVTVTGPTSDRRGDKFAGMIGLRPDFAPVTEANREIVGEPDDLFDDFEVVEDEDSLTPQQFLDSLDLYRASGDETERERVRRRLVSSAWHAIVDHRRTAVHVFNLEAVDDLTPILRPLSKIRLRQPITQIDLSAFHDALANLVSGSIDIMTAAILRVRMLRHLAYGNPDLITSEALRLFEASAPSKRFWQVFATDLFFRAMCNYVLLSDAVVDELRLATEEYRNDAGGDPLPLLHDRLLDPVACASEMTYAEMTAALVLCNINSLQYNRPCASMAHAHCTCRGAHRVGPHAA